MKKVTVKQDYPLWFAMAIITADIILRAVTIGLAAYFINQLIGKL